MEDVADPQDRRQQGVGNGEEHPEVERVPETLWVLRGEAGSGCVRLIRFDGARRRLAPFDRTLTLLTWTFSLIAARLEKNSDHALAWIATPATPATPSPAATKPGEPPEGARQTRRRDEAGGNPRDVRRTPPVAVPASALATAASSIRPTKPSANSELVRLLTMGDAGWNVSFMDPPTVIVDTW